MEFCSVCDNMYYMKMEENELAYFCKHCGNIDKELIKTNNLKVYKHTKGQIKSKDVHINEFTKFDPTLPHVYHIKCPNPECLCNKNPEQYKQDVVYIRYDDRDMKFTYLCFHCDFHWNT